MFELSGLRDVEEPGAFAHIAEAGCSPLVFFATGPDALSLRMLNNSLLSLKKINLAASAFVLADSADTCKKISARCWWSSRVVHRRPSSSLAVDRFWDWRFRLYAVKKEVLLQLLRHGCDRIIQSDTDTFWYADPFSVLDAIPAPIVFQQDRPIANAGLFYVRRHPLVYRLLEDIVWRVRLMQHAPDAVRFLVSWAKQPYYANSDDQTILHDVLLSLHTGRRVFLTTAKYEADNAHAGVRKNISWQTRPENALYRRLLQDLGAQRRHHKVTDRHFASIYGDVAIASPSIFAHSHHNGSVVHVAAHRGFQNKVQFFRARGMWLSQ